MLRSAQICKKCTILGNLRTITQERKKESRQMTLLFSSTFWAVTVCDIHFCIWKLPKFIFMGSSFRPFWSAKYLNFGGVSCEIRILSRSIQETYTLRKVKNQVLLFLLSWEPNLPNVMIYFCLFQMLFCVGLMLRFWNFKPTFLKMQFSFVATFFSTFGYLFELKFTWVFNIYII